MSNLDGSLARVIAQLERFRRRLILVAFVRALPITLAIALGAAVVVAQVVHSAANATVTAAAVGLAVGVVAASLVAYRRTRGLTEVAATLDRRFGLANRLETALAFASHDDGMTSLIAADADVALSRRRLQDVAFEAPRHLTWIVVGAAVVVVASFAVRQSPSDDVSVASQGVLGADAGASSSTGRRTPASAPSPSSVSDAAPRAAAETSGRRATTPSSDSNRLAGVDQPASRQAVSTEPGSQPVARAGEPRPNAAAETARTSGEAKGATAARAREGRASTNAVSPNQAQLARGDLGGGVGANALRTSTARAGGVRGTGAEPSASSDKQQIAVTDGPAAPLAAWDRAESAIEREHLPLALRTYVHDYLVAIKSGGLP